MSLARAIRASMLAGLVAVPVSPAMAEIQWNGFLSVGAGKTFGSEEKHAGYGEDVSFGPDSVLGLQASSDLGENLSVTGQLVTRGESGEVKAEWLYLSYQFNPNLRVNVGRQRLPLFLHSDYLDVGYAYHFQRPPTSVYSSPINSGDNVTLLYDRMMGPVEAKLQVFTGSYNESGLTVDGMDGELNLNIHQNTGGALTLIYDSWLTFRANYVSSKITIDGTGYAAVPAIRQLALDAGNAAVAKAFDSEDAKYTFAGVAVSADLDDYLLMAEATEIKMDNNDQETKAFYVSAARRFGSFMPYVTLERSEVRSNSDLYQDIVFTDPASLNAALRGAVNAYANGVDVNEYLYSVGVRYDFHPSAALKVQYTKVDDQRDEALTGTSRDANLLSFSIDTVF